MRGKALFGLLSLLALLPWALGHAAQPLHHTTATALGGRLYVIGGYSGGWNPVNNVFEYDPATDRWRSRSPMPTPRGALGAAEIEGKIYATGGRIGGSYARNLSDNEVYDSVADRWERRQPMPTARSGIAGAAAGGRLFVFGGEAPAGTFNQTEAYDPVTDRWTTLTPTPTARHGLGAEVVGGVIYVIGGGPRPGGSYSAVNEAFTP